MSKDFPYIDSYDVMEQLKISQRTVSRLVKRGILHAYRLPHTRKNYFLQEEITQLLANNIITPTGQLDKIALEIAQRKKPP